jgi:hypothetical protein
MSIDTALRGSRECNFAPLNDMKAYGGIMLYIHSFLTSTLDAYKWPASCSGRFTLAVRDRMDLTASVDVSEHYPKSDPGSSIPQRSHYTNWATHDSVTAVLTSSRTTVRNLTIKSHKISSYVLKFDSHVLINKYGRSSDPAASYRRHCRRQPALRRPLTHSVEEQELRSANDSGTGSSFQTRDRTNETRKKDKKLCLL